MNHALLIAIWKLANGCSYRDLSDRFCVGRGASHKIVLKTIRMISKHQRMFIKWPLTHVELTRKIEEFQALRRYPFPYVIGCVDATHVRIPAPSSNKESYYNRHGTHSMILQVSLRNISNYQIIIRTFLSYIVF